jgi:hypothetical protein
MDGTTYVHIESENVCERRKVKWRKKKQMFVDGWILNHHAGKDSRCEDLHPCPS